MAEKRSEISELVAQISSGDQLEETHANWQKLAQAAAEVERLQQDIERMSGAPGQLQALRAREEELRAQERTLQLKYSENKGIRQNLSAHLEDRIQALANPAYRQLELNIVDLAI